MNHAKLLKITLINFSIGTSAVRNQGNGIAEPIREKLRQKFSFPVFFKNLKHKNDTNFERYLDSLTEKLVGLEGVSNNENPPGVVQWGTARKCINLLFRSVVYNGFMWSEFEIKVADFKSGRLMDRLEVPLDSYTAKGIKRDSMRFRRIGFNNDLYPSFSIIGLGKVESAYYQEKALLVAQKKNICRVDLDLRYWRNQEAI
ncbi:hypothetical protein HRH25_21285 [Flavisolibacter sp. BT320]|nr:hypothetical protein [Flavisolibacter longurius]